VVATRIIVCGLRILSIKNKFYALAEDKHGDLNSFLLHSYSDNACVVELIAISKATTKKRYWLKFIQISGIWAYQRSILEKKVGAQVRDMGAINFYHKVGCK